jgi:chromate reductase, NAD(P)H dehydrogenase (quinone)
MPPTIIRILGISGSLRAASFNTALLRAAKTLAEPEVQFDIATLHGIPLYDGDVEARDGLPQAVLALRNSIQACDGLLLATPEYNNGFPGVFKNAIDWLSRTSPEHPSVLSGKPVAIIGASPGGFGTILAQTAWLPVLRTLSMHYWAGGRLMVSKAHTVLIDGALQDPALTKQLSAFVQGFAAFARAAKTAV